MQGYSNNYTISEILVQVFLSKAIVESFRKTSLFCKNLSNNDCTTLCTSNNHTGNNFTAIYITESQFQCHSTQRPVFILTVVQLSACIKATQLLRCPQNITTPVPYSFVPKVFYVLPQSTVHINFWFLIK